MWDMTHCDETYCNGKAALRGSGVFMCVFVFCEFVDVYMYTYIYVSICIMTHCDEDHCNGRAALRVSRVFMCVYVFSEFVYVCMYTRIYVFYTYKYIYINIYT